MLPSRPVNSMGGLRTPSTPTHHGSVSRDLCYMVSGELPQQYHLPVQPRVGADVSLAWTQTGGGEEE